MKNKVTTCGYFIKRLRDNGYKVNRIFSDYVNYDWTGDFKFELSDGNRFKTLQLKTDSMEVIMTKLIEKDILPSEEKHT